MTSLALWAIAVDDSTGSMDERATGTLFGSRTSAVGLWRTSRDTPPSMAPVEHASSQGDRQHGFTICTLCILYIDMLCVPY